MFYDLSSDYLWKDQNLKLKVVSGYKKQPPQ